MPTNNLSIAWPNDSFDPGIAGVPILTRVPQAVDSTKLAAVIAAVQAEPPGLTLIKDGAVAAVGALGPPGPGPAASPSGFIGAQGGTLVAPADVTVWSVQPIDPAKAPFNCIIGGAAFAGTWDEVLYLGYNCGPGGTRVKNTEPRFSFQIEQDYNDGSGADKVESYFEWQSIDGLQQKRPLFWQINRNTGALTAAILRQSTLLLTDWNSNNTYATFQEGVCSIAATPLQAATLSVGQGSGPGQHSLFLMYDGAVPGGSSFYIQTLGAANVQINTPAGGLVSFFDGRGIAVNAQDNTAGFVVVSGSQAVTAKFRGKAAGQGDLTQWQDSTNAVLSRIGSAGRFITKVPTAPILADLSDGELALWIDAATGNLKVTSRVAGALKNATVAVA